VARTRLIITGSLEARVGWPGPQMMCPALTRSAALTASTRGFDSSKRADLAVRFFSTPSPRPDRFACHKFRLRMMRAALQDHWASIQRKTERFLRKVSNVRSGRDGWSHHRCFYRSRCAQRSEIPRFVRISGHPIINRQSSGTSLGTQALFATAATHVPTDHCLGARHNICITIAAKE
jgi:hypothetical protein